jgi:hypothetical protein
VAFVKPAFLLSVGGACGRPISAVCRLLDNIAGWVDYRMLWNAELAKGDPQGKERIYENTPWWALRISLERAASITRRRPDLSTPGRLARFGGSNSTIHT